MTRLREDGEKVEGLSFERGEFSSLNWLRSAFAFLVLVSHARQHLFLGFSELSETERNPLVRAFYFFTAFGRPSVVGFFVLSGYLITHLYFRHLKAGSLSPSAFLVNRGVRLYAVLLPVLIGSGLLGYFSPLASPVSWESFLAHLLFLQVLPLQYFAGNRPLWSLGYEAWCYVAFCGCVSGAFQIQRGRVASGWAWLLCGVAPLLIFSTWMLHYLVLWALGGLGALYFERVQRSESTANTFGSAFASVMTLAGFLSMRLGWIPSPFGDYAVAVPLAISLALSKGGKDMPTSLAARLGAFFAGFSYSLYLTHFLIVLLFAHFMGSAHRPNVHAISLWGALVLLCVGFSYAFSTLTERHTKAVRAFLGRKLHLKLNPT